MAVPKRRSSNSRSGRRRAHHFRVPKQLTACPKCSTPVEHHVICPKCGRYQGRPIIEMDEPETSSEKTEK